MDRGCVHGPPSQSAINDSCYSARAVSKDSRITLSAYDHSELLYTLSRKFGRNDKMNMLERANRLNTPFSHSISNSSVYTPSLKEYVLSHLC